MSGFVLRTTILLYLGCAGAFGASAPQPVATHFDGMILRVSGSCSVTSDKGARAAHAGDLLRTGDQLRCEQGNAFFHMGCADQLLNAKSAPLTVSWAKGKTPCNEKLLRSIYESYDAEVGHKKGASDFFISPGHERRVASSLLVLRWHPVKGNLQFELREPKAEDPLWKSDAVDGGSGTLESLPLREALAAAQTRDSSQTLELRAVGASARRVAQIRFMPVPEEQELTTELASVEFIGGNLFFHQIARAALLKRRGLDAESAQAFEAALAMSPQSPLLRERAIEMNELIGNRQRVRELTAAVH